MVNDYCKFGAEVLVIQRHLKLERSTIEGVVSNGFGFLHVLVERFRLLLHVFGSILLWVGKLPKPVELYQYFAEMTVSSHLMYFSRDIIVWGWYSSLWSVC
ncbi:hypothetical protein V6N11_018298 [Hibiscus sabdariffa]|uniref:Uncharacterized protein n=1 Tax=Hibiscus sabdariffa TaxID=183260 RepID=A0ABR2T6Z6_9ROSI